MTRSLRFLVAALLVPGAGAALARSEKAPAVAAAPTGPAAAPASARRLVIPPPPPERFVRGAQARYRIEYATSVTTPAAARAAGADRAQGPAPGDDPVTGAEVRGTFSLTVLEGAPGGALVALRMEDGTVSLAPAGGELCARAAAARTALGRLAVARVVPSGRLLSARVDPSGDPVAQGLARALLAALQVVITDADLATDRWEAEEEDLTGRYLARYVREAGTPAGAPTRFTKEKLRYLDAPAPSAGEPAQPEVHVSGSLRGRLDPRDLALRSLQGTESLRLELAGRELRTVRSRLAVTLVERRRADPAALAAAEDEAESLRRATDAVLLGPGSPSPASHARSDAAAGPLVRPVSAQAFESRRKVLSSRAPAAVRAAALRELWSWRTAFPQAEGVVRHATRDPCQVVREAARGALADAGARW